MGGGDEWSNLTAACRGCNLSKGSRSLLSFLSGSAVGKDQWTAQEERRTAWWARYDAADEIERRRMRLLAGYGS